MCRFCFRSLLGCCCFLVRACEGPTTLAFTQHSFASDLSVHDIRSWSLIHETLIHHTTLVHKPHSLIKHTRSSATRSSHTAFLKHTALDHHTTLVHHTIRHSLNTHRSFTTELALLGVGTFVLWAHRAWQHCILAWFLGHRQRNTHAHSHWHLWVSRPQLLSLSVILTYYTPLIFTSVTLWTPLRFFSRSFRHFQSLR
jgi:hypothetical protein